MDAQNTQEYLEVSGNQEVEDKTIMELFPNFAEREDINEKTNVEIRRLFSNVRDRSDLETIWKDNDKMYRCKPDASKDSEHRANESTGVFHVSVNQLVSMAFKTFTENEENYRYGFRGAVDDEAANILRGKNAEIMTLLFKRAQSRQKFKRNLKRALLDCYKNGICFVGIPFEKRVIDLTYRDKSTGNRKSKKFIKDNLPGFEFIPVDRVWLDPNLDTIEEQPAIFIKSPISWSTILRDRKNSEVKLFEDIRKEDDSRSNFEKYKEHIYSSEFSSVQADRFENADRDYADRTSGTYKHWVIWMNLPIDKKTGKWDKDADEIQCRVRILGDPNNCDIIEIRENVFPCGIPILSANQTEDDIGIYHISLGEKIKTYFDQICVAIDQLMDNRSKNCRRPFVYDPIRVDVSKYDFGHSNGIPCQGDPRTALAEMQIADMTATIMPTIQYLEMKIREVMNTTDAVMGVAMGGRTSASEYMNARTAATTPIFSDLASIEDALIGEYMRRFAQYIHTFMTHDDIIDQIGIIGAEFQFDLADIYTVELNGVSEAMDKMTKTNNLLQIIGLTQDANARSKIMLRLAEAMGIENPAEFVSIPAKDQAIKAALWENNEMLVYGQVDEPEQGELHDVHEAIHQQALWMAQRDKNPNMNLMEDHLNKTRYLKRIEQAQSGMSSFPQNGQAANQPTAPGLESGQDIAATFGNAQAGSPIPAEPALPEAM